MAPPTERLLCLSILGYRKPGMSEEDYHKYLTNVHRPLVQSLMVKYGIVQYTMVCSLCYSLNFITAGD